VPETLFLLTLKKPYSGLQITTLYVGWDVTIAESQQSERWVMLQSLIGAPLNL